MRVTPTEGTSAGAGQQKDLRNNQRNEAEHPKQIKTRKKYNNEREKREKIVQRV